jgi:hypothetical protein
MARGPRRQKQTADPQPSATTPDPAVAEQHRQLAQTAFRAPVPRLYANGFMIGQTASDTSVVLLLHGSPIGILNLSFISAKSLAIGLDATIKEFEKRMKQEIPTLQDVMEKMGQVPGTINVTV